MNNQCSPEEVEALMIYFNTRHHQLLSELILHELEQPDLEVSHGEYDELLNNTYKKIQTNINRNRKASYPVWRRIGVAASVLIFLSIGGYFILHKKQLKIQPVAKIQQNDVTPGTNGATLTLGNGQKIVLNAKPIGQLALQGNVAISKTNNGQIKYKAISGETDLAMINTVTTQRKEQYHLTLSDGTNVWLNAASSIKYPSAFTGKNRKVEITGEAYFEVAHNKDKPFLVTSNGQTVEVLGTHFNINTYDDEIGIKTTLLEGSVKVSKNGKTAMIKPGQQAVVLDNEQSIEVKEADTEQAVAWKNGFFDFKDANIQDIMRQLSRWYDVDVRYDGEIPTRDFSGEMERSLNASQVLKLLSYSRIHFRIEGKTIIVTP